MKKTCIVTGGSSGIGLSIIELFLANNYQVFNLDIIPSKLGVFKKCDVTRVKEVEQIINDISHEYAIDVLVSNAGIHFSGILKIHQKLTWNVYLTLMLKAPMQQ